MSSTQQEPNADSQTKEQYVDISMGKHEIFFKKEYKILYTVNEFLLGLWFLIGSICFYFEELKTWGVTLFVLGSMQMLIRPSIRLVHSFHMRKHYEREYDEKQ
ncbi:YrhK family protein [Halobacillus mangrovi]|uniref:YrhK family protein n=1 Tax=Halobacillus mangrovi TaxID=402384 RepID=UPI003D99B3B9